jgi:nucleoside-diphosphate-sugar epimerase
MNIAILGGTGFIGGQVTTQLARLGHRLLVFHRGTQPPPDQPNVTSFLGERNSLSAHAAAFRRFDPQAVIDVIGYSRHDARELVAAFSDSPARVVALSSIDVYRNWSGLYGHRDHPPDLLPLQEKSPLRTRLYPYADPAKPFDPETTYDKILVEETLRAGLPGRTTILRLAAIYGPGDRRHRLWPYLKRMRDQRPFILVERTQAGWPLTRGYVENAAAAVVAAALHQITREATYNVGETAFFTEAAWITRLAASTGWTGRILTLPNPALPAHLRSPYDWRYGFGLDCKGLRAATGFTDPVPLSLALRRTLDWEVENPPPDDPAEFDYRAEDLAVRTDSEGLSLIPS